MSEQLADLQSRFAFQELALEELSDVVAKQARLIAELREELDRVKTELRELNASPLDADPVDEPPPPHY